MGETNGFRSDMIVIYFVAAVILTAILSQNTKSHAQGIKPLPETILTPPAESILTTPMATVPGSAPILQSPPLTTPPTPVYKYSATLDPIIVNQSDQVNTIEDIRNSLDEPGSRGWFAQVDGFWWRESIEIHGERYKLLEETGPIFSVGYQARKPRQRYRIAIFGGSPEYDGATWDNEPLTSTTDYIGVVGEYDFRWPLFGSPTNGFFAGVGTRWWSRNLQNSVTEYGNLSLGYKETWWTIYPRIGLDSMRRLQNGMHLYTSGSLGFTAYTSENIDFLDVTLQPQSDVYTRAEIGLRSKRLLLSLVLEHLGWNDSDDENGIYQPRSTMFTAGMLLGYNF